MLVCPLGLVQEALIMGARAITFPLVTSAGSLLGSLNSVALGSGGCSGKLRLWAELWGSRARQVCSLQPASASSLLWLHSSFFLPPLWSLFPNPLGLHKYATWLLKKASFFSLIIKLPRNNGCHLKHQH